MTPPTIPTPNDPAAPAGPADAADPTLRPTAFIDSDHAAVRAFAALHARGASPRERAVALYLAVRDGFRYDPYRVDMSPAGLRASTVLANGYGWCVPKAVLLAAACRAVGIPARLGYADVRNHLSTERMREVMQTDLFVWHGYTDILIEGRWLKATPAFNLQLCERFGLVPLEFDGRADSIYHPYDRAGNRHMEYVRQRGSFDDLPLAQMLADFAALYPMWKPGAQPGSALAGADFLADVAKEVRP
ncbi:MAG: transglutaminase family protein [Burkholderiales bacterium]|nr:transglutaminase family protein [Burkholderiales bacterium]